MTARPGLPGAPAYGELGRIGLLVPSNNTVVEPDFRRVLPPGYAAFATRMMNTRAEADDLAEMTRHAVRGAAELATAGVQLIAFACTSGSFLKGRDWDAELRRRLEVASGIPAVTTSQAIVDALAALKARRVAVATPYVEEVNRREHDFLTSHGLEVVGIEGLGIAESVAIARLDPTTACDLVRALPWRQADAVLVSCANFPVLPVLEALEAEVGRPVLSSTQATVWKCLRVLGYRGQVSGFGRLLEIQDPRAS